MVDKRRGAAYEELESQRIITKNKEHVDLFIIDGQGE